MSRPLRTRSSRVSTKGTCKTGKRRYRSEIDAKIAMAGMSSGRRAQEVRTYLCPACRGHHTTSQTIEEYEAKKAAHGDA